MLEPVDQIVPAVPVHREPYLTPTEQRLLQFLQDRPGQVVARGELVRRVLNDDLSFGRTIDVHVRALRRKLGPAARILTFRGEGYAWDREPAAPCPLPLPATSG